MRHRSILYRLHEPRAPRGGIDDAPGDGGLGAAAAGTSTPADSGGEGGGSSVPAQRRHAGEGGGGGDRPASGGNARRRRAEARARPAAPPPRDRGGSKALRAARGLAAAAPHRPHGQSAVPAPARRSRRRPSAVGAARSQAPRTRRRRATGAEPQRHVLAADGRAHVPRRASRPGGPRPRLARASRPLALGGDEDAPLRARRPLPHGHGLPRRRCPRARARRREVSSRRRRLDVHDAPADSRREAPVERPRAQGGAPVRGVRPEDRPGGRPRHGARHRRRSATGPSRHGSGD